MIKVVDDFMHSNPILSRIFEYNLPYFLTYFLLILGSGDTISCFISSMISTAGLFTLDITSGLLVEVSPMVSIFSLFDLASLSDKSSAVFLIEFCPLFFFFFFFLFFFFLFGSRFDKC